MTKSAYRGLAAFRFALRQFLSFSEIVAASAGITTQQYQALLALKAAENEKLSVKELAQELLLAQNAAVQLIDRLEVLKLAKRTGSKIDRRSVTISLTQSGQALIQRLASEHVGELARHEPLLAESLRRLRQIGK
jgi:DNA-binding MarR family transcriptional regulator